MGGATSMCVRECGRTPAQEAVSEDVVADLHPRSLTRINFVKGGAKIPASWASGTRRSSGSQEMAQVVVQVRAPQPEVAVVAHQSEAETAPDDPFVGKRAEAQRESQTTSQQGGSPTLSAQAEQEISYEGALAGPLKHGIGKLVLASSVYEGEFVCDLKHGCGILSWDDGRLYRGGFERGHFHGRAVMTWPDGRKYVGTYVDDRKDGEGTFVWQDGRKYQGQWVAGKRHGVGVYTNAKGVTRQGMWQMDRPVHWEAPGAESQHSMVDPLTVEVDVARSLEKLALKCTVL